MFLGEPKLGETTDCRSAKRPEPAGKKRARGTAREGGRSDGRGGGEPAGEVAGWLYRLPRGGHGEGPTASSGGARKLSMGMGISTIHKPQQFLKFLIRIPQNTNSKYTEVRGLAAAAAATAAPPAVVLSSPHLQPRRPPSSQAQRPPAQTVGLLRFRLGFGWRMGKARGIGWEGDDVSVGARPAARLR